MSPLHADFLNDYKILYCNCSLFLKVLDYPIDVLDDVAQQLKEREKNNIATILLDATDHITVVIKLTRGLVGKTYRGA